MRGGAKHLEEEQGSCGCRLGRVPPSHGGVRPAPPCPQTPTPEWPSLGKATWEQTHACRMDARPFWSARLGRSPRPRLFISCPPLAGSPVVYVMCGKEMTIKSLLWFGHSSWPPGSHKGLKEAQLQADTKCKSLRRVVGEARPPPASRLPGAGRRALRMGSPGPRWDSVPLHSPQPLAIPSAAPLQAWQGRRADVPRGGLPPMRQAAPPTAGRSWEPGAPAGSSGGREGPRLETDVQMYMPHRREHRR